MDYVFGIFIQSVYVDRRRAQTISVINRNCMRRDLSNNIGLPRQFCLFLEGYMCLVNVSSRKQDILFLKWFAPLRSILNLFDVRLQFFCVCLFFVYFNYILLVYVGTKSSL